MHTMLCILELRFLFVGPKMSDQVSNESKSVRNLAESEKAVKKWSPEKWPCRFYEIYVSNVKFIWKRSWMRNISHCKILV